MEPLTDSNLVSDTAYDLLTQAYRDWSVDRFLCHPAEAIKLCREVRRRLHRPQLKDHQILWTLVNARKRGRVKSAIKRNPDRR